MSDPATSFLSFETVVPLIPTRSTKMSDHICNTDRYDLSKRCTAGYPDRYDTVIAGIEPTQKYQVCWARTARFTCDFGILLQIEKAVGIERTVALDAVCTALVGCGNTCDENKTVVELAGLLVKNHKLTAREIEDALFSVEFGYGDGDRAFEEFHARSRINVLYEIEAALGGPLAPKIPEGPETEGEVTYYSSFLAGFFLGRAQ